VGGSLQNVGGPKKICSLRLLNLDPPPSNPWRRPWVVRWSNTAEWPEWHMVVCGSNTADWSGWRIVFKSKFCFKALMHWCVSSKCCHFCDICDLYDIWNEYGHNGLMQYNKWRMLSTYSSDEEKWINSVAENNKFIWKFSADCLFRKTINWQKYIQSLYLI